MSLDLSAVGFTTAPSSFTYDWKTVVLYALRIGAKRDELDYLSKAKKPKIYPTFAVVPVISVVLGCVGKTGDNPATIVHKKQNIRLHRLIPPKGKLVTTATVKGVYDLKKMGQ